MEKDAFEHLASDYPGWEISRDGGERGYWCARRGDVEVTAETPTGLLVRLEARELARLQKEYGKRYSIRRSPTLWIATCRVDDGTEPTLIKDTSHELEAAMCTPGPWGQVPRSRRPQ
ncbi:hypothetical protein ACOALZ_02055 [Nocardiopsis algeriensis]|uniref:hypothetical protein n=1 Tax=Nocardiopsis algeriensis TaxID=1478215 RepID=UPI003B438736